MQEEKQLFKSNGCEETQLLLKLLRGKEEAGNEYPNSASFTLCYWPNQWQPEDKGAQMTNFVEISP